MSRLASGIAGGNTGRISYRSGMQHRDFARWLLLGALGVFLVAAAGWAGGKKASGGIAVRATVRPYARVETVSHPQTLVVTKEDVKRGYVVVIEGGGLTVRTNSTGYLVTVELRGELPIVVAELSGFGASRSLGPDGGTIQRYTGGPGRESIDMGWRFHLVEGATPGIYEWPARITVTPR
jgi:hypothetical protein